MTENEFLNKKDELQCQMGRWTIEIGVEIFADYVMGYFYDKRDKKWKVYINNEHGRHRIRLISSNQSEAIEELLSMVEFEIENNKLI